MRKFRGPVLYLRRSDDPELQGRVSSKLGLRVEVFRHGRVSDEGVSAP